MSPQLGTELPCKLCGFLRPAPDDDHEHSALVRLLAQVGRPSAERVHLAD